jgi:hypothetical protein
MIFPDDHLLFVCHDAVMRWLVRCAAAAEGWRVEEFAIEGKYSQRPPAT